MSTIVLLWHLIVWPMESRLQNLLYALNEYLYAACTIFSLGFSGYNYDPLTRYNVGWQYLILLGAILTSNIVVMIVDMVTGLIKCCKRRTEAKKVETEKKERQERMARRLRDDAYSSA